MIKGFVGTYGSGKTLQLVRQAQWYFQRGYPVLSNMPIWGFRGKKMVTSRFLYNDDVFELLRGTLFQPVPTLLIIDEASNLFDSYTFKKIPPEIFDVLKQSRKIKLDIFYTSQRHQDIATRIRDNSEIIYICKNHFRGTPFHMYTALGVEPHYFNDQAKSTDLKQYIKKRRLDLAFMMKKYYKFYSTEFIITNKKTYLKYIDHLGDPTDITPEEIIRQSKLHKDIRPPL